MNLLCRFSGNYNRSICFCYYAKNKITADKNRLKPKKYIYYYGDRLSHRRTTQKILRSSLFVSFAYLQPINSLKKKISSFSSTPSPCYRRSKLYLSVFTMHGLAVNYADDLKKLHPFITWQSTSHCCFITFCCLTAIQQPWAVNRSELHPKNKNSWSFKL